MSYMLLILFQLGPLGPLTPLLFLLLSSLRWLQARNISDFTVKQLQHGANWKLKTLSGFFLCPLHQAYTPSFISICCVSNSKDSLNIFHNVATPCHSGPSHWKHQRLQGCLLFQLSCEECHLSDPTHYPSHQARRANLWHPPKLTVGFSITKLRLKRSGEWMSKPIVLTKSQLKHVEGSKQSVGR